MAESVPVYIVDLTCNWSTLPVRVLAEGALSICNLHNLDGRDYRTTELTSRVP